MWWITVGRPAFCGRGTGRRQRDCDARYGAGNWRLRHRVAGESLELASAATHIERSYRAYFQRQPEVLDWLCAAAHDVIQFATSNVRSVATTTCRSESSRISTTSPCGAVLAELGRELRGEKLVQMGGRGRTAQLLSPGHILFHKPELIAQPALRGWWLADSIECFWQSNRVLEVRDGSLRT